MHKAYWLVNIRLEDGYEVEDSTPVRTLTKQYHLFVENGKIAKIVSAEEQIKDHHDKIEGGGMLALPPIADSHFHLDKSYYGEEWKAAKPAAHLLDRLEEEAKILPGKLNTVEVTARLLIDKIMEAGTTHIRTHVNIDPYVGLRHLEIVREVLDDYRDRLTYEIVAFPQQGLLRTNAAALMREAMRNGATHVGGLDPGGIDRNIERSLADMMDIAVEANADIDIHLHDPDYLGLYTINKLLSLTEEAGWVDRVAISHGFALGGVTLSEAQETAERMASCGVRLISAATMRARTTLPPLEELKARGVQVDLGCDSIFDWWGPFGNASIIDRLSLLAEYNSWIDERSLAESLGYITRGITPLSAAGDRVWPQAGDDASMILTEARCSPEFIARRSQAVKIIHQGVLQNKRGESA
ncbi:amidohydrolase [Paenibacillus shunpengii]|uniref:Amidohydrolase n=1 Tax=Paenibacillus shunpengii TaxID=2054424 RepID=A0ABW5SPS6_9BACL|nr:amidohydrolase [Paenibacillus sp. PDC88]SDW72177.1 Cytosine/adenosine deaminase [Paenibacillus sp. PDC88]